MQRAEGRSVLLIASVSREAVGTFTCKAQNGVQNSEGAVIVVTEETVINILGRLGIVLALRVDWGEAGGACSVAISDTL